MSFLLGASLFLGAMLNFWGVNIFMLNTQKTTKKQWNHLTCREQWHNKISNIAASTIYCLKPTYGPYGNLWISWNFLFDGGEQKLNPFQTNCHFRATPNSVVKGTAKATCTNEHKRSPPPQLTVKANTTVDLRLPICPGTLHKSCWEKTSCDLQWIWSGINRSLIFLWFSICLYYEVKFTTLTRNNLKTYCRFEVTSRDITNSIVILGS